MVISLVATVGGWATGTADANEINASEDNEADFLRKLIGYIEWPAAAFPNADAPIVVGIVGAGSMYESLSRAAQGRQAHGRPIEVRALREPFQVAGAHMLYVGAASWPDRARWTAAVWERPPVLVTNAPAGVDQGATIGFLNVGQRVRIEASLPAAQAASVKLSSRLLVVAERVVETGK